MDGTGRLGSLQSEHFLPCAGPKYDAVGSGGRLQRREGVIGSDVAQVGRPCSSMKVPWRVNRFRIRVMI